MNAYKQIGAVLGLALVLSLIPSSMSASGPPAPVIALASDQPNAVDVPIRSSSDDAEEQGVGGLDPTVFDNLKSRHLVEM